MLVPESKDPDFPLVESQMYPDPEFYGRYFAELFLYLKQYPTKRDWHGLVLLKDEELDLSVERPYRINLKGQVQRVYLDQLASQEGVKGNLRLLQLVSLPEARLVEAAKEILAENSDQALRRQRLDLLEMILAARLPHLSSEDIKQMLGLKDSDLKQSRFYQDILSEGQQEEALTLLLKMMSRRFGSLTEVQRSWVQTLSLEQLEELGEALLDFQGVQDLENWLNSKHYGVSSAVVKCSGS